MVDQPPAPAQRPSCNCIAETNAMLKERNTVLVTTMFRKPDVCVLATERLKVLRNGARAALVVASFCPFCGVKYAMVDAEPEPASAPEAPYPPGAENNAKRAGWDAFFAGKPGATCPFPPNRPDLRVKWLEGWSAAQTHHLRSHP